MANDLLRFRVRSGTIEYYHWDFPDQGEKQKYEFTMSDFDMFDQWVHFVRMSFLLFVCFCFTFTYIACLTFMNINISINLQFCNL